MDVIDGVGNVQLDGSGVSVVFRDAHLKLQARTHAASTRDYWILAGEGEAQTSQTSQKTSQTPCVVHTVPNGCL